jgi:gas vesicle protein
MNDKDFFSGLLDDHEKFSELVAGAEHFVRMKKQAAGWGEAAAHLPEYVAPMARHALYGAVPGAVAGAAMSDQHPVQGALTGAVVGGATGVGIGHLHAHNLRADNAFNHVLGAHGHTSESFAGLPAAEQEILKQKATAHAATQPLYPHPAVAPGAAPEVAPAAAPVVKQANWAADLHPWVKPMARHFAMGAAPGAVAGAVADRDSTLGGAVKGGLVGGTAAVLGGHAKGRLKNYRDVMKAKGTSVKELASASHPDRMAKLKGIHEEASKLPVYHDTVKEAAGHHWVKPVAKHFAMGAVPGAVAGGAMDEDNRTRGALVGGVGGGLVGVAGGHVHARRTRFKKALSDMFGEDHQKFLEGHTPEQKKDLVSKVKTLAKDYPVYPRPEKTAAVIQRFRKAFEKIASPAYTPAVAQALSHSGGRSQLPLLMGLGALIGGGLTYAGSSPNEDREGRSWDEDKLDSLVKGRKGKPENGLAHKVLNRSEELALGLAKAFREHPIKASLIGGGAGAGAGYGLARALGMVVKGAK